MSLVLRSLVSPSLWITAVKISASGLMYVTGVTVTGVTFLMDNTSEDQCIRSYACHWCYRHWCHLPYGNAERSVHQVLCMSLELQSLVSPSLWITPVKISASGLFMSLVSPSLWITPVKISASGLMYVTGVTFLMDNTSEDQCIRSYVCHWCHLPYG